MLHRPELIKQGRLPIEHSKREELVCDIPGVPPTRLVDLPSPLQDPRHFYSFYARNCEQMHEATGVLVNTFYELEPSYIDKLRKTLYSNVSNVSCKESGHRLSILPVGPLLPEAYFATSDTEAPVSLDAREPCLLWLDAQPGSSVLYVSFGSVARIYSVAQIHELAAVLEASGGRFLLTLRQPLHPENAQLFPEGFEERTKNRGFVQIGWTPQLKVLSHRVVGSS